MIKSNLQFSKDLTGWIFRDYKGDASRIEIPETNRLAQEIYIVSREHIVGRGFCNLLIEF